MIMVHRKKVFLILFLFLSCLILLSAGEKILVWEAVHPGKAGKLFLAGSIHLGKKTLYPLDRTYDQILAQSHEMIFEIFEEDLRAMQKKAADFILRKAFFPPGKDLIQLMGERNFLLLDSFYASKGLPFARNNGKRRRPWLVMLDLAQMQASDCGFSAQYGFEEVFKKLRQNKPGRGLEEVYTQLSMLEGTDEKILCKIILEGIKNPAKQKNELENILGSFQTGSLDFLEKHVKKMEEKYPLFHKRLLLARNLQMVEKLEKYAAEKKTFFVLIGAAHFAGKGNILLLLKEKGFRIKQLDAAGKKGRITGDDDA